MATFTVLGEFPYDNEMSYVLALFSFDGEQFEQLITARSATVDATLMAYLAEFEAAWSALRLSEPLDA
jgi:hypothetical protein